MKSPLSLSVQSKLVAAFTLLTLLAIVLVSAIGYLSARKSLRTAAENQLIGLQRSKVGLIRTMLTSTRNEIEEGDAVLVLVSGAVSLQVVQDGEEREIAAVVPGESFGEAGMYGVQTAEVRAVALQDSEVLRLSPDVIRTLFEASPSLARDTGHTLEVRRRALQSARAAARRG